MSSSEDTGGLSWGFYLPLPAPFLVRSTTTYPCPAFGVGGNRLPLVVVRSSPVRPPRGPTISTCPELGAFMPGFSDLDAPMMASPYLAHPGLLQTENSWSSCASFWYGTPKVLELEVNHDRPNLKPRRQCPRLQAFLQN